MNPTTFTSDTFSWKYECHQHQKQHVIPWSRMKCFKIRSLHLLVYTTQMNSTGCARWLASSEVISQVLFTSEQPKKNKKAFVRTFSQIKLLFGPLVIQNVWYILKQSFTAVSVKVVDVNLASSRIGKYPPLFTSTSINNCWSLLYFFYDWVPQCQWKWWISTSPLRDSVNIHHYSPLLRWTIVNYCYFLLWLSTPADISYFPPLFTSIFRNVSGKDVNKLPTQFFDWETNWNFRKTLKSLFDISSHK